MTKIANNINKLSKINNISDDDDKLDILQLISKYKELYIDTKKSENLSKYSIRNMILTLDRFYDYIADEFGNDGNLSINEINRYFINNYLSILEKQGLSPLSQKLYTTIIKNFIIFIADNDTEKYKNLKSNIMGIKIKTTQKEKIGFSQNDQKLLINLFDKLDAKNTYTAHRKSLMLKILYFAGVRASELASIKWSDIVEQNDEQHGLLYVILIKGKGDKERFAYLQYDIIAKNYDLIKQRNATSVYLFETAHGNIPNPANIYIEVKNELQKAGIQKFGLHIFRHTFARNLVSKDINLATIKDLLGHSNITVTAQFYAKSDEHAKRNALFKKGVV